MPVFCRFRRRGFTLTLAVLLATTSLGLVGPGIPGRAGPLDPALDPVVDPLVDTAATQAGACDPIDPAHCLLPFPNDHFTVADESTDSGRRVDLSPLAMPRNVAGKPIDPTEWNRNDGFSPGSPVLALVPDLDLHETWGTTELPEDERDHLADIARYLEADAPIVILDATDPEHPRHAFWSEVDTAEARAYEKADERALILRPAVNFAEGHRYVVAMRDLKDGNGNLIAAGPAFAAVRDGDEPAVPDPALEARRAHLEREVFPVVEAAGIARDEQLYLAWDFTAASERNLSERVLHIRDLAFELLGDTDLADRRYDGVPPEFTVTEVEERTGPTARTVKGTITVPNFLTPQVIIDSTLPRPVGDALDPVEDALPGPLDDVVGVFTGDDAKQVVPGYRLFDGDSDGLPDQNPVQPTVEVEWDCHLPSTATAADPADAVIYGHGLLGSRGEARGGSTEDLRLRNFAVCAIDWWGMSSADLANVALILPDFSNFPTLADRSQQGFLNFTYLGRALAHPDGFATDPAFQDADGEPVVRTGRLLYDGNSQGGIMGGALVALSPDIERAKLGVPGMNYSTLLNRSVDWEGTYAELNYPAYPDKLEQQLIFALIQMIWDRADANGYAHHMTGLTGAPFPNTPAHDVMLQVAFSDHQVANVSAEVEGRTIGAQLLVPPTLGEGSGLDHWSVDPLFGFDPVVFGGAAESEDQGPGDGPGVRRGPPPHPPEPPGPPVARGPDDPSEGTSGMAVARGVRAVLIYWTSLGEGLTTPPMGNVPSTTGSDPHEHPRRENSASDQLAHWFRTGDLLDVCGGAACTTTDESRSNS